MSFQSIRGLTIGRNFTSKECYNPSADLLLTDFEQKKKFSERTIVHFFVWDTHFGPISTDGGMLKLLAEAKGKGVKYVCQTDFSAWYFQYEERKKAIRKNFRNLELILQEGFTPLINFNNIYDDEFDFYKSVLPHKLFTVVYDFNHNEKEYAHRELLALSRFLKYFYIDKFIVITGKMLIPKEYHPFFTLIKKQGIEICFAPTEMTKLKLKRKLFYN